MDGLSDDMPRLKANSISRLEVIMSGLVQIAPASSVVLTTALMAGLAGGTVPLVFLIGMVGVLCTGNALVQFTRLWPSSGSFVTYISRAVGPRVGLVVALVALLGYIIAFAGIYLFVGQFIVSEILHSNSTAGATIAGIVYGLVVLVPVIVGVQVGIRAAIFMYLIEVVIILIISAAILVQGGDHGLTAAPLSFQGASLSGIASAFALAILGYVGFEAPAPLAEESEDPRRNVPIGIFVGIVASGALFVIASYAGIMAFPSAAAYAASASPFTDATARFIPMLGGVIDALFLTSITASFIIANSQTSRVIFSGAREGLWPRKISAIHPRFNTPWLAAIAFVLPSLAIAGLTMALTNGDLGTISGFLSTYGTLGIIFMYAMTNVSLIVLWFRERRHGRPRPLLTWLVLPVLGVAVMAIPFWSSLKGGQDPPFNLLPWFFIALLVVAFAYTAWFAWRRPELVKNAAALAMGESTTAQEV